MQGGDLQLVENESKLRGAPLLLSRSESTKDLGHEEVPGLNVRVFYYP